MPFVDTCGRPARDTGMNEIQHRPIGSQAKKMGLRDLESGSQATEPVWATVARDKSPGDQQKQDLGFLVVTNSRTVVYTAKWGACPRRFCTGSE